MQGIAPPAAYRTHSASKVRTCQTLRKLGLGEAELTAVSHQGYLQHDNRGHGHSGYCRLRFRFGKSIRTVYLGRDEQLIEHVKQELEALQNDQRLHRQAGQVAKHGRRMLRLAKNRMAGVLCQLGMHYHGDAIRRFRGTHDRTDKTLFMNKEE